MRQSGWGGGAHFARKREGKTGALLPEYVSTKYLQPFISDELLKILKNPISYVNKKGKNVSGVDAA